MTLTRQLKFRPRITASVWLGIVLVAGLCGFTDDTKLSQPPPDITAAPRFESQLNTFTASTQANATVDILPDGNMVAAWDSRRQQSGKYGVYARLLNAHGEPLSPEVQVNQDWKNHQTTPTLAASPDGTIWIVWQAHGRDGSGGSIVGRRFTALLEPLGDEFAVNQSREGSQRQPTIDVNEFGETMICWTTPDIDIGGSSIAARLFDSSGRAMTDEVQLRSVQPVETVSLRIIHDTLPVVTASADGGFILAFARFQPNAVALRWSILAQRFSRGGSQIEEQIVVSPTDGGVHVEPSIDADSNGNVLIAWLERNAELYRPMFRRFDSHTAALGDVHPIDMNSGDVTWMSGVAVAMRGSGDSVVLFNTEHTNTPTATEPGLVEESAPVVAQPERTHEIVGVRINSNGEQVGESFSVNQSASGMHTLTVASTARRVALADSGQLAIAWYGQSTANDDSAANVTVFAPRSIQPAMPDPVRLASGARDEEAAAPPIPPIYDPNWKPLPPPTEPLNPGMDFGFLGINFTGWTPPDPEIAVGPNHIVAMTNGAIAFFDKQGALLFQDEIENSFGFWGQQGATGFVFDPECLFDPESQRFFAMAAERGSDGRSYYLLAVSDDDNPVGTWHKYRILAPTDNDIDSPNMGVDADILYLTSDMFGPDKYHIYMIEKNPLLSGGAVNAQKMIITGAGEQSMGVPIHFGSNPAGYLIQSSEGANNGIRLDEVRFHALQDPFGNPSRVTVDVTVPTYSFPNQPPQQGTGNRPFLFEPRFWSCMYVNDSFWAVHHVNSQRVRARWYEFHMNGWPDSGQNPSLHQWGEIDPGPGVHTFFPSIAADANGNAVILFSRSASDEFISIGRAFRKASDPLGQFRPAEFVKQSTVPYTGSNRWGDYSHIEPDPADPGTFWGAHEWTDSSSSWRTWIAKVDTSTSISADLTAVQVNVGTLLSGGVNEIRSSDNQKLHTRSGFGRSLVELHLLSMTVGASTTVVNPSTLSLAVESSVDQPAATLTVGLRNRTTDRFDMVGQTSVGIDDTVGSFPNIPAGEYVDEMGGMQMQVKHIVFVPFLAFTFESFFDHVEIVVED